MVPATFNADLSETSELLPRAAHQRQRMGKAVVALLLVMKICSNMFENQMASFDINAFNKTAAEAGVCVIEKKTPNSMLTVIVLALATAAFVLPTLGGLLSDAFIGCLRTLWIGAGLQLCGSVMLTAFDSAGLVCRMPLYLLTWVPVLLYMGFGDTMLLYAPLRIVSNSRDRQVVLFLYFVAAATGETLGNVPSGLKYFTERSFEFFSVIFGICCILCLAVLALKTEHTALGSDKTQDFVRPRKRRLLKFYLIVAGTIPHITCITLCRVTLYWQQIRVFTRANGDEDVLAFFIPLAGYQTATISLSLLGAAAVSKFGTPGWFNLMFRIRAGLCLMAASKVPLLLLSLLDYHSAIYMESWSPFAVWAIYFASSFCDGVANVLATIAIYELIYCVADAGAKATMVGIFYTVWGLAIFLNGAILLTLQACNVLSLDSDIRMKPKSHYAYGCVICLLLVAIAYWEKISWPRASGLLADHEAEEADGLEGPQMRPLAR